MPDNTPMTCHQPLRITAAMRRWLRRRMAMRAGGRLANPFTRLSRAVIRAAAAHRFRPCKPEYRSLTIHIPSPQRFAKLGLGPGGGGGGSPGCATRS